ncbi:hypothetical protein AB0E59_17815 [Lentzea sp. NPDC034063]
MRIVVALGGNALLMRGERADASVQLHHLAELLVGQNELLAQLREDSA